MPYVNAIRDIRNCFDKLNDPGKPALRGLGILPQQLTTSPLFARSNAATIFRSMKRASPRLASERAYIICGFPVTATIRPNAWRSRADSRRQPVNFVPAHLGMKLGCLVWTFGALPASPARRMTCEPAGARPARPGWRTAEPTSVASTLRPI